MLVLLAIVGCGGGVDVGTILTHDWAWRLAPNPLATDELGERIVRLQMAAAIWNQLPGEGPPEPQVLLLLARAHRDAGELSEARRQLIDMLSLIDDAAYAEPEFEKAMAMAELAVVSTLMGRLRDAEVLHERILATVTLSEAGGWPPSYFRFIASVYLAFGLMERAEPLLEREMSQYRTVARGRPQCLLLKHEQLANTYLNHGWPEKAEQHCLSALSQWRNGDQESWSVWGLRRCLNRLADGYASPAGAEHLRSHARELIHSPGLRACGCDRIWGRRPGTSPRLRAQGRRPGRPL